ncbi:MAG TPA: 2-oxo acid dehydrogenase subunit E2 [Chroococcidiopsis sp.]
MQPPDPIGQFAVHRFPEFRNPTIDILNWGRTRHHIPILLEIDVTEARHAIRAQHAKTGQRISFTGWVVACLAQAVSEHKSIHALRRGDRHVVVFDDVDVMVVVERAVAQAEHSSERSSEPSAAGERLPMPYIIRRANAKTVAEIHAEIRAAQHAPVAAGEVQIDAHRASWLTKIGTMLPRFMRDLLFWRPLLRDPFRVKRLMGTVSVTSVGMAGQGGLSWGIPIGIHPLIVAVGAIAKRPGVVHDQIAVREYVGLTVLFDHDVTDGAPVARFIRCLQGLMTRGYGLSETPE